MNKKNAGWSLLELLIVVALLLLFIGVAIPKLMDMLHSVKDLLALIR